MDADRRIRNQKRNVSLRIKSLLYDWLFICTYLLVLFAVMMFFYLVIFDSIPELSHMQSQLVATATSIAPIIIIFSAMEGSNSYASWGKKKTHLQVTYQSHPLRGSVVRNSLKFLPWQLGHMSTIYGIYNGYESVFPLICLVLSISLAVIYIGMAFLRKDGRHLADLLAGSQVIKR